MKYFYENLRWRRSTYVWKYLQRSKREEREKIVNEDDAKKI